MTPQQILAIPPKVLTQAQRDLSRARSSELSAIIDYNQSLVDFEAVQIAPIR